MGLFAACYGSFSHLVSCVIIEAAAENYALSREIGELKLTAGWGSLVQKVPFKKNDSFRTIERPSI